MSIKSGGWHTKLKVAPKKIRNGGRHRFPDILDIAGASTEKVRESVLPLFSFSSSRPFFVCVISHSKTSEIPGITVAGANKELVKYTSAADSEFLYYGRCECIDAIPATPDGKPTPAVITRAVLQLARIPFLVVRAGTQIEPSIPYVSFGLGPGENISTRDAMDRSKVRAAFRYGSELGRQLACSSDMLVIGESIPAGTTTALAVMCALGIDARFKVSSSMPENPHQLKNKIVDMAMQRSGIEFGDLKDDPFEAISLMGDPMMPSIAGIAAGATAAGARVMLAGGTQMAAIVAIMAALHIPLKGVCIGTTSYVATDHSSSLGYLLRSISDEVPAFAANIHLAESSRPGLQAFARGFVKEGVGAGGVSIAAMLKSKGKIDGKAILHAVEEEYDLLMQAGRNQAR